MSQHTAPKRTALAVLLGFAATVISPTVVWAGDPKSAIQPLLTIEGAIDAAKRCVLERNIRLVGSFIESARFERDSRGDRGPLWVVTWANSREIKGGQVFATIYVNGSCELRFGE
jgi:hypothetical protein